MSTPYVTVALLSELDSEGVAHVAIESSPGLAPATIVHILSAAALSLVDAGYLGEEMKGYDKRDGHDVSEPTE